MYGKAVEAQKQSIARIKGYRTGFNLPKEELYRRLKLYERGESYHSD